MQDNFPVYDGNKQKKSVFISMYQNVQKAEQAEGGSLIFVYLNTQIRSAQSWK